MDDLREKLNRLVNRREGNKDPEGSSDPQSPDKDPRLPSIRERFLRLERKGAPEWAGDRGHRSQGCRLEEVLGGEVAKTPFGECLEIQGTYRAQYRHGRYCLEDLRLLDLQELDRICGGPGSQAIRAEEILFMDLETTGLSLGAGTWVFLAGYGYLRDTQYHVRQFFLRNFDEERAFLYEAGRLMEGFRYLVTFNGKRFDIPLLEGRYAFHRQGQSLSSLVSWDLLYPARRLWRDRLQDCRLETIEQGRLLVTREEEDIRGDRIPETFFRYVHTGDARNLDRILYHNAMDVLTLASLATHVMRSSRERDPGEVNLLSLGRYYERQGIEEEGRKCYEIVSSRGPIRREREAALFRLSMRNKREGRIQEAISGWEELIREGAACLPACCEELAKYHEHRTGDLEKAIRFAETALENIHSPEARLCCQMEKRLERLLRKRGQRR